MKWFTRPSRRPSSPRRIPTLRRPQPLTLPRTLRAALRGKDVVEVAAGATASLALTKDGAVFAIGCTFRKCNPAFDEDADVEDDRFLDDDTVHLLPHQTFPLPDDESADTVGTCNF